MIETAREPEFRYPRIDNFCTEEEERGLSWGPIYKDIQKSAENQDQLWLQRILQNHKIEEKEMKLRLQKVTCLNLDRQRML